MANVIGAAVLSSVLQVIFSIVVLRRPMPRF
ncbi:hypothetical protein STH1320 [Symbiobacterium thermophilum IAM 14863]|uniref:Uncharacterized protein n=1 Tax=Symbiobacterium thermophilum (strain DSM 24528 / JCM 14929 / IAM 14863 / T) TaxID=292459 RepID=Q67PT8_SYMTH|nr:hypothetical protein STH1320 [Symbiobacterium thermophilum IAM 14863]